MAITQLHYYPSHKHIHEDRIDKLAHSATFGLSFLIFPLEQSIQSIFSEWHQILGLSLVHRFKAPLGH